MPAAALTIYVLGLALAFGWRSVVQWRRTGDTGLRLDAGPPGWISWWAKLTFVAALLLGFAGPVGALAGIDPLGLLDRQWIGVTGLALAITGVLCTLAAQLGMGDSWRVGVDPAERTTLVTTGPFAIARNPIFTAMAVTSVGLALMTPNPLALAASVLLILAVQVQVRVVEEPYLRRVHNGAYAAYAARVGRFLPGIGRARPLTDRVGE